MRVLLTGGAGYVGSACFRAFRRRGLEAFVLDDLSEGHEAAVDVHRLVRADLRDTEAVARALRNLSIDSVVHFAALTSVPQSLADPSGYWSVNVDGSRSLLEAMRAAGVRRIVFSSTAAVYAHGIDRPIREDDPIRPATPYGTSKLAVEHLLEGYACAYGFAATALRYFNAAGADADGLHGEAHRAETHAIPLLLQTALGQRPAFRVFGSDWPTRDGSCIRDFVSVEDLGDAHYRALIRLEADRCRCFNLGSGNGSSVLELIGAAERVLGRPIPHQFEGRRPGDPPVLVADIGKARSELGWEPRNSRVEEMLRRALAWHAKHPAGYEGEVAAAMRQEPVEAPFPTAFLHQSTALA